VVEGLDLAVMKLNEGEVAEVSIAPQYGFGDAEAVRAQGSVPPGSRLHYTVEIVGLTKVRSARPRLLPPMRSCMYEACIMHACIFSKVLQQKCCACGFPVGQDVNLHAEQRWWAEGLSPPVDGRARVALYGHLPSSPVQLLCCAASTHNADGAGICIDRD
jgi:hypothetical protein